MNIKRIQQVTLAISLFAIIIQQPCIIYADSNEYCLAPRGFPSIESLVDLSLTEYPEYIINDLLAVGPEKSVGYLFLNTIGSEQLHAQITYYLKVKNRLSKTNLKSCVVNLSAIDNNSLTTSDPRYSQAKALFVYDEKTLAAFFEKHKNPLSAYKIPQEPALFFAYIAKNEIPHLLKRTIRIELLGDQSIPQKISFLEEEKTIKTLLESTDTAEQKKAAKELNAYNSKEAIDALIWALSTPNIPYGIKLNALYSLRDMSLTGRGVSPAVFHSVSDKLTDKYDALLHLERHKMLELQQWLGEQNLIGRSIVTIERQDGAKASGFVCGEDDEAYYIMTNTHVVRTESKVTVRCTFDDTEVEVEGYVGVRYATNHPEKDCAIVGVLKENLPENTKLVPLEFIDRLHSKSVTGMHTCIVSGFHNIVRPGQIVEHDGPVFGLAHSFGYGGAGDSGSPFMARVDNKPVVIGIIAGTFRRDISLTLKNRRGLAADMRFAMSTYGEHPGFDTFVYNHHFPGLFHLIKAMLNKFFTEQDPATAPEAPVAESI